MSLFPLHSGHPMVIHFPLVALVAAPALDALGAWSGSSRWRLTATFLWWVGLLGAAAAVATGLIAFARVEHSDLAHLQMILHRNLAFATVAVLVITAIWRWRRPNSLGAALLGLLGAGGLLGVGYLGGELVFRHAVGVPTETIEQVMMERGGHSHGGDHMMDPLPAADSSSKGAAQEHGVGHPHEGPDSTPSR